ncbi:DUF5675 family protein [Thiomicrorhabdus lithotrophica]|uniref:DUF5675 family protein n=1 Tax=Thiomicrorhabdus lithotrophica TaxID=2949997 RepID=A0ABY8C869_9GAMM|nr:DUF5675 family protein [Thiomicrorhabdus lithotrophica]WEJ62166.1 DUF5675 family protein [Thiomicrorhabdus lithotrophica]
MKTLELYREPSTDMGTKGDLMLGDKVVCKMLEPPWRDNVTNISCIPPGRYEVEYLAVSASGKYKDVYYIKDAMQHVKAIVSRDGVLIHKGNWAGDVSLGYKSDSEACQLPCMGYTVDENRQLMGYDSATAMQAIHEAVGRSSFILEVYGV